MVRIAEYLKGVVIALIILTALVVVGKRVVSVSIGDILHDEEMRLRRQYVGFDKMLDSIER